MKKKLPQLLAATVVHPSEYNAFSQWSRAIRISNRERSLFPQCDIGKVIGLYEAWLQSTDPVIQLNRQIAAREELLAAAREVFNFEEEKDLPPSMPINIMATIEDCRILEKALRKEIPA